jgi:hypothetical protein
LQLVDLRQATHREQQRSRGEREALVDQLSTLQATRAAERSSAEAAHAKELRAAQASADAEVERALKEQRDTCERQAREAVAEHKAAMARVASAAAAELQDQKQTNARLAAQARIFLQAVHA